MLLTGHLISIGQGKPVHYFVHIAKEILQYEVVKKGM